MSNTPITESPIEQRRQRIQRAEALLDRWLELYDILLQRAHRALAESEAAPKLPDITRLTDLANAFTITRRACEFELLAQRLQDSRQQEETYLLDPELLLEAMEGDDPDE